MGVKNNYINTELSFAESQLESWRKYIEDNPINMLQDRWGKKEMPKGGHTWVVTATIEQQVKSIQDTLTRYLQLLEVVDKLREREEAKIESRGKGEVKGQAESWLKKKSK